MKLLTKEIKQRIPKLYTQDGKGEEAVIHVKFFTPDANWTWYATEASAFLNDEEGTEIPLSELTDAHDVEDIRFFGLVHGFEKELGYFSLNELSRARGPLGLPIERDRYFGTHTIGEVQRGEVY